MVNRKSLLRGLAAAFAVAGVGVFAGCGGVSPGEYVFYRIASAETEKTAGCNGQADVPIDVASDSSTLRGSGTFILYAGNDDKIYLDTGKLTLEGAETDTGYGFAGKTVDVNFYPMNDASGAKVTNTTSYSITVNVDGKTITGTSTVKTSGKCSGNNCDQEPARSAIFLPCTQTNDFIGTEIDDVDLRYDVGGGTK